MRGLCWFGEMTREPETIPPPPLSPSSSFSFSSHHRAGSSSHPFTTLSTLCRVHQCVSNATLIWCPTADLLRMGINERSCRSARTTRADRFFSITIVSGAMVQNLELNIPVYCIALKIVFKYRVVLKIARISYRVQENMFYYPL